MVWSKSNISNRTMDKMNNIKNGLTGILISIGLISCAVHPVREEVKLPEFVPAFFSESGEEERIDRWWESFESGELSRVVNIALQNNYDLKTAWARLGQFAALLKISGAELYPQVNLNEEISRTESDQGRFSSNTDRFALNLSAAYEVDLWKRIESQQQAAVFDYHANRETLESTALALSALVTERWLFIVEQKAQLALLNEQLKSSQTFLELNELRFSQGRATAVDVYQQRGQLASVESQFPIIESNIEVFENQLSLLLGETPEYNIENIPSQLPDMPPIPQTGVPGDVLMQRPDVRSLHHQIVAADYRVASAIADRYPTLRLTGQAGFQTGRIEDVFDDTLWNIAAGIVTPIIDGERRKAEIERNKAIWRERLFQYQETVLTALHEIENAIIQERKQKERVDAIQNQLNVARQTLTESQSRFLNGLSDFLPVLTALIETQRLERQLLSDRRDLLIFRVDLYEALGGTWMSQLKHSDDPMQITQKDESV